MTADRVTDRKNQKEYILRENARVEKWRKMFPTINTLIAKKSSKREWPASFAENNKNSIFKSSPGYGKVYPNHLEAESGLYSLASMKSRSNFQRLTLKCLKTMIILNKILLF